MCVCAALCGQHSHERAGEGDEEGERCAVIAESGWQGMVESDVRTAFFFFEIHQFKIKLINFPSPRTCRTQPAWLAHTSQNSHQLNPKRKTHFQLNSTSKCSLAVAITKQHSYRRARSVRVGVTTHRHHRTATSSIPAGAEEGGGACRRDRPAHDPS